MQEVFRVGEVAKQTGVGAQTLHFYERMGLVPKAKRSPSNYRLYPHDTVQRVQFIKKAQQLGFSLAEIKQILEAKMRGRAPCTDVAELGEKHLQQVDERLSQLRAYREELAGAVARWRQQTAGWRRCAGEFCDLIERL